MPEHECEMSWGVLRRIVQDWAGTATDLLESMPLEGGTVSTTLALTLSDHRKVVLKVTPHRVDRSHLDEACQLRLMREIGLPVPEVYAAQVGSLDNPFSYILMEFVEGIDLRAAKSACTEEEFDAIQSHLAELLLQMHDTTDDHYRRVVAEESKRFESWPACYREIFDPIWRDVEKSNVLPVKSRKTISRMHDRLESLLVHDDRPRLVHWDVWATNLLAHRNGDGRWKVSALLDPNSKFAHAEAELAYMDLFHTATPAFFRAYQNARRLPNEYHRVRKPVYQMYSLLNHLRRFGKEYLRPASAQVEKVAALV